MSIIFSPITIGDVTVRNRLWMSPMCQYMADPATGLPNDWHYRHYAERGYGGSGAIIVEATAVNREGRISPYDLVLDSDEQLEAFTKLASVIKATGATPGIQIGHAGRKASGPRPWEMIAFPPESEIGWQPVAPSPIAFDGYPEPTELSGEQIEGIIDDFATCAELAVRAGFEIIEIHGAHGYLVHQFLSPLSNTRTDEWGRDRTAFVRAITERLRPIVPGVLAIRISATDWLDNVESWTVDDSIALCSTLKSMGLDLVDVSSGGNTADAPIVTGEAYQVPFARQIYPVALVTSTVGRLTDPIAAEALIGEATDIISIGRQLLSDPYLPQAWRWALGDGPELPDPYHRAWKR